MKKRFFYEPRSICYRCHHEPRVRIDRDSTTIYCPNCQQSIKRKTDAAASRAWLKANPDVIKEKRFYSYVFISKKTPVRVHACSVCGGFPCPSELRGFILLRCQGCGKHTLNRSIEGSLNGWNDSNPLANTDEVEISK